MASRLYIDHLYDALQKAISEEIIRDWTVDGHKVVFIRQGGAVSVPVLKAGKYLNELYHEHEALVPI